MLMIKKYIKIIGITCLDFFAITSIVIRLPGIIGDFILELKSSLGIISRPNISGPLFVFLEILFLLMFTSLVIYFNVAEYRKLKNVLNKK